MPYLLRISLTTRSRRCTQPPQPPPPSACSITTLAQSDRSPCHFVSHPFHSAVVTSGLQRPPVAPQSRRILPSSSFAHAHPRRCTQPPQPMPPSACSITTLAQSGRSPCHFVSHPFHSAVVTSGLQRPPVAPQSRRILPSSSFAHVLHPPVHATTATTATKCLLDCHPRTEQPQSMPLRDPPLS
jgi:hypothetical protein